MLNVRRKVETESLTLSTTIVEVKSRRKKRKDIMQ